MCWTYFPTKTRAQVVESIFRPLQVTDFQRNGDVIWTIERGRIYCYVIGHRGAEWGYAKISEEQAPNYWDCPSDFLATTEPVNPEWREKVRAYRAKELKP